jgi:hypothetical protein
MGGDRGWKIFLQSAQIIEITYVTGNKSRDDAILFGALISNTYNYLQAAGVDFAMVFLVLQRKPNRGATIAVVNIDGTGSRKLIRDDSEKGIVGLSSFLSWSWDKYYLLLITRAESAHLSIISLADGQ